jgi:hypothetical protein
MTQLKDIKEGAKFRFPNGTLIWRKGFSDKILGIEGTYSYCSRVSIPVEKGHENKIVHENDQVIPIL